MDSSFLTTYPLVQIGEFARSIRREILIDPSSSYRTMGVKWWGLGAYERETKFGSEIKAAKMFLVKENDLVINKIWVRHGSSGIVTDPLDGCVVTSDFPTFELDLSKVIPQWLSNLFQCEWFWKACEASSRGTSGRQRIDPEKYLQIMVPLPSLEDQRRIVRRIDAIQHRINEVYALQITTEQRIADARNSLISSITGEAERKALKEIAPLIRRPIKIDPEFEYLELGIRSFGKGTFHKPSVRGDALNGKRLFKIEPDDLLFSNVFAWEGAVAVAKPEDTGRYGSHRFISRKPIEGVASADFLYYYFTTPEGIEQLGKASPGSAGRNRTLGLKMLDEIEVPLPSYEKQLWVVSIAKRLEDLKKRQVMIEQEADGFFRSILDESFRGELQEP